MTGVVRRADLALGISAIPNPAIIGRSLVYRVVVTNMGPSEAMGVVLTDTLPAGVTFGGVNPGTPTCTQGGGVVVCGLGQISSGAAATVTLTVTPTALVTITNVAEVVATEVDPRLVNNSASLAMAVQPVPVCHDFDGDGWVQVADLQAVSGRWENPALYDAQYDVVPNGAITLEDIIAVAGQWGQMCIPGMP